MTQQKLISDKVAPDSKNVTGRSNALTPLADEGATPFIEEIWRDIVGYEGLYQISNLGRVKSLARIVNHNKYPSFSLKEKILCSWLTTNGYPQVKLYKRDGEKIIKKTYLVYRIVAIAFIPNPENKPEVNHINGVTTDIRLENLEWSTHKENMNHARDVLKRFWGNKNGKANMAHLSMERNKGRFFKKK